MNTISATRLTLWSLIAISAASLPAVAGSRPDVPIPERMRGAQRTVVARVASVRPTWVTNRWGDQLIVSQLTLAVEETLKGQAAQSLQLQMEGGTLDGLTLHVSDMPSLEAGDRGVFMLDDASAVQTVPHRRGLGVLKLDRQNRVENSDVTLDMIREMARQAR